MSRQSSLSNKRLKEQVKEHEERFKMIEYMLQEAGRLLMEASRQSILMREELKEFKDEMKEFKDEMKEFKDEMKEFKDEMKEFKNEMREFKDEMKEFKEETRREFQKLMQEMGRVSQKMGTLVEDFFYPGVKPLLQKYFNIEAPHFLGCRIKKRLNGREREFDILATYDKKVFLFEVKSTLRPQDAQEFVKNRSRQFFTFFPEYQNFELLLFMGSLTIDQSVINYLTKKGVYAVAMREWEYLDILNFNEVRKIIGGVESDE